MNYEPTPYKYKSPYKCTAASKDFVCIGGYPQGKDHDMNYGTAAELKQHAKHIKQLPVPARDPVFGKQGFLKSYWKTEAK